jgi:hypothetical protein
MASIAKGVESILPYHKVVTITVAENGKIESVTPDPFHVSLEKQEQVIWEINNPKFNFTVEFTHGSPFYESQFASKNHTISGLVRRSVLADALKCYKYTVRVEHEDQHDEKDPGGIINQ